MNLLRRTTGVLLLVALATLAATGCSISGDQSPRDIDRIALADTAVAESNTGAAATGSGRIYLLAAEVPGIPSRLQAVARDVADDPTAVLRALVAGPNSLEFVDQLRSALPLDLELNGARLRSGGILEVDLNGALQQLSSDLLISAVAQLVYTASATTGVGSVLITVDGTPAQWPAGNGELQIEPLTVYDYPGLEPSSQPALPGTPPAVAAT